MKPSILSEKHISYIPKCFTARTITVYRWVTFVIGIVIQVIAIVCERHFGFE